MTPSIAASLSTRLSHRATLTEGRFQGRVKIRPCGHGGGVTGNPGSCQGPLRAGRGGAKAGTGGLPSGRVARSPLALRPGKVGGASEFFLPGDTCICRFRMEKKKKSHLPVLTRAPYTQAHTLMAHAHTHPHAINHSCFWNDFRSSLKFHLPSATAYLPRDATVFPAYSCVFTISLVIFFLALFTGEGPACVECSLNEYLDKRLLHMQVAHVC